MKLRSLLFDTAHTPRIAHPGGARPNLQRDSHLHRRHRRRKPLCGSDDTRERTLWNDNWRPDNCGTVYQLTHSGSNWLFSTLAALPHNCDPYARVVFGPDGHLYGTSYGGRNVQRWHRFQADTPCRDL